MKKIILILVLLLFGCENTDSPEVIVEVDRTPVIEKVTETVRVPLITSNMDSKNYYVVSRPKGKNGNKILIADEIYLKRHIWVEITEDTIVDGTVFASDDWSNYWRYGYRVEVDKIDATSYPYEAKALKIEVYYNTAPTITGVVRTITGKTVGITAFDNGALYVGFSETVSSIEGYDGTPSSVIDVGDIITFSYEFILESFPGSTEAVELIEVDEFEIPPIIRSHFNSDEAVFMGMFSKEYERNRYPMFWLNETECAPEGENKFKEHSLQCDSFDEFAFIIDGEVLNMLEAFEEGYFKPDNFWWLHQLWFTDNYDYYTKYPLMVDFENDEVFVKVYTHVEDNRFFFETRPLGEEDHVDSRLKIELLGEESRDYTSSIHKYNDIEEIFTEGYNECVIYLDELEIGRFDVNGGE